MHLRRAISTSLALLLFTSGVAAFACDAYCVPPAPAPPETAASEHDTHAHHHAAAPSRPGTDAVLAAAGHPPQCSMTAETPRTPRAVRSTNGAAGNHLALQLDITRASATPAYAAVLAPSPPPSPPLPFVPPLRI